MSKLPTIKQKTSFYALFSRTGQTDLLFTERRYAKSKLKEALALIKERNQFKDVKIKFNEDRVHQSWALSLKDKDIHKATTYDDCYRLRAISNTEIEVILYSGDFVNGQPEPVSLFCTAPKIQSHFTIKDDSGKLVGKLFSKELKTLTRRLVEQEKEQAREQIIQRRCKEVMTGLKKGVYDPESGIELFTASIEN